MMMYAVLAYSLTTGLCAFAFSWTSFAILLLFVGIAIGSEWVTGSSMVAEIWPTAARGKGAGLMQCGFGVGFFVASLLWLFISRLGPGAWRYMYVIGVLPAFLTLWIQNSIEESDAWEKANAERKAALAREKAAGVADSKAGGFTLFNLFKDPVLRTRTIFVFLMSLTTTVGFWSISTWVPPYIASLATAAGLQGQSWASYAGMCYTAGSVVGYITVGFLADTWGRKPVTMLFFLMSLVLTPVLFFLTHDLNVLLVLAFVNAIFSNGQYTWMPVWLPELYPTRVRATALAFAFNAPRFVACFGPILAGTLIVQFGGYGKAAVSMSLIYIVGLAAAPFLPETHGKPLPQ
jgi:MFS family permease